MSDAQTDSITILTIGTADSGGTMYPVGQAIAEVISDADNQIKVNLSASHGSADNVKALENGEIDLGLVSGDTAYAAVHGENEFAENPAENLRAIAAVYPSLSNWMIPEEHGLTWVNELVGKRIGVGPQGSTTEVSAKIVLDTLKIDEQNSTIKNCGIGSGVEEIKSGTLDAIHGFTGIPIGSLKEFSEGTPCTLLQYTEQELKNILEENSFYYPDVIPAGTYEGQEEDVSTFGIKCLLCVDASMDEELVYKLTGELMESAEILGEKHKSMTSMMTEGFMFEELPIELHPGAEKFYMEKGLIKQ